jgi:thioredoxin-like negative regulator of GroEL
LEKSQLTYKESKQIFRVISSALAYAHKQGVLHRDVKPSNVLLDKAGGIYLADFGLARITETSQTTLSGQMMMGTPHYISPEQAKGLGNLDSGTDIYSLGVMTYELLVGDVPFQADTPFSVIHDHIYSPLPLPKDINPDINDEMQRALLKSLAKKREDRFVDIQEMMSAFIQAFDILIQEHPSEGEAPTLALDAEERRTASIRRAQVAEEEQKIAEAARVAKEEEKKSKVPGWIGWLLIPALVLLCLSSVVLGNARAVPGPDLITAGTLTQEAAVINASESGEIQTLNQQIRDDPQNPFLRYQLGVAYMNAERPQLARQAFQEAYQLAEGDPETILDLGELLTEIEIWTYAAYSFLKVEQLGSPIPNEDLQLKIHESLYYAAFEDFSLATLSNNPEIVLDSGIEQLMQARRALQNGQTGRALEIVDRVMVERPDLLEAYLLKIDILYAQEQYEPAANLLVELQARPDLPEWIRLASAAESEKIQ